MSAATADREAKNYLEQLRAYPVAAATTIYNGVAVAVNASGYAVLLTDSAAVKFVGIASEGVINTTAVGFGSNGDLNVKVHTRGVHAMVSAGLAITDQHVDLYWADNQTVQKAPTNQYAGKLARYTSATEALVDIEPALTVQPVGDDADYLELPVSANKVIAANDLIGRDADGYVCAANDATVVEFVGIAMEAADNTGGADGAINVFIRRSGLVALTTSGAAVTDGDRPVFVDAAATVTLTPTDRNLFVGIIAKFVSATSVVVDLKPGLLGQVADVVSVGVAATKTVTARSMVALDADGYLVDADDTTAVDFWGIALTGAVNTGGADGALSVWVARSGLFQLTGAGLAATDAGKEVWQVTDAVTVTTTPGDHLVGILEFINGATAARVNIRPLPKRGDRADRQFTISFSHSGATLNGKSAFADREYKRKYVVLSMFADVETAPGGTDTLTCTLTDGTTTFAAVITGAATHGENKTPELTTPMKANFDTDLTLTDTATTSADVKGEILCEWC
jgi:hypothetical protein